MQTQQDISTLQTTTLTKTAAAAAFSSDYNDLLIRIDALYYSFHKNTSTNVAPVIAPHIVGSTVLLDYQPSLDLL